MKWSAESIAVPARWGWETRVSLAAMASVFVMVSAWLYFGLPVLLLPVLIGTGVLVVLTLRHPIIGVLTVVAAQYLPLRIEGLTFLQLVGGGVALLCLVYCALTRRGLVFSWIVLPIVALVLHTLHSFNYTHDVVVTQYVVRKLFLNILYCLLLVNIVDDFKKLRGLLWVIVGMAMVNGFVGAIQFSGVSGGVAEGFRSKGLQENENQLGELSAVGLMVAIYAFLYGDRRWKQLLGLMVCVALSLGLVTSISRGAVLALVVGMVWIAIRESRRRMRMAVIGILILLAFPLLPESFFDRFRKLNTDMRGTVVLSQRTGLTTRGYYNKAGIKIWKAHPILGVGLGNYGYYYVQPEFNPGLMGGKKLPPHNIYVQALAETGVVGFTALCWWIALAGLNYWRAERKISEDRGDRSTLRASEALTVVALVGYFSGGSLFSSNLAMILTLSYLCRRCAEKVRASPGADAYETPVLSRA
ncbi:MAG: O-antigen ligase family protein [Acidobacteria bacterium]|nr:O-antigen ligase family protein [Acidobacteriota bacterium]